MWHQCRLQNNAASCTCLPGMKGDPYIECKPECTINQECPGHLACIDNKCKNPCPGLCGNHARCSVVNHAPPCSCDPGYYGDPFRACSFRTTNPPPTEVVNPCNPSPCGSNAICQKEIEQLLVNVYQNFWSPYVACRPECVVNSDCPSNKACQRNKCIDPCPGTCGINGVCTVKNHFAACSCLPGYTGDPFTACKLKPVSTAPVIAEDPCDPNPCDRRERYASVLAYLA